MKRRVLFHDVISLCCLFTLGSAYFRRTQDGSSSKIHHSMPLDEQTAAGSFGRVVDSGMSHLHYSLTTMWDETHDGVHHASGQESSGKAIPIGRQQMYFRPVSVTLNCVMALTIVGLLVYTALSLSRNSDELSATFSPSVPTQMLTIAARVACFAPMLCMLFVACRMYILATTEGLGEPPTWVKKCMWTSVSGMAMQLVIVLALPAFSRKQALEDASYDMTAGKLAAWQASHDDTQPPTEEEINEDVEGGATLNVHEATGEQNDVHPDLSRIELKKDLSHLSVPFWLSQAFSMMLIYGGISGVIVGIFTFPAQSTKVSAAVLCTIYLSILYFVVSFILWFFRSCAESDSPLTNAALAMSTAARKAPMLAVIFLASRMRALQLDPPNGMPPLWMQSCFYSIVALMYLETVVSAFIGGIGESEKGYYGVYIFRSPRKAVHLLHHASALISYVLLALVVRGVIHMKDHTGEPAPLSTTLASVLTMAGMYFGVMCVQSLVMFMEEFFDEDLPIWRRSSIAAGVSLSLAPLLCILFVATRMRALQITQQQGSPPGWAQDCMMIATFAVGVQSVCCLLMPIFIGKACEVDADGNPDYDLKPMIGAYAVAVVKYVALMALHGSVIAVCTSVYIMTPSTAHDGGTILNDRKEFLEGILVVLVIFFIALLFSSAKVVGIAIKYAIESADKDIIGVDIEIKKVALNIFKGYVHVQRLKVMQPENELDWHRDNDGKLVENICPIEKDKKFGTLTGNKCEWAEDYIAKVDLVLIKLNLWRLATTFGGEFELENLSVTGIHFNVEKPDTDYHKENANIQYILNHLDSKGYLHQKVKKKEKPKKEEPTKEEPTKEEQAEPKKEDPKKEGMPTIKIGKLVLGDIGAGVHIRGVKFLGEIKFHPTIGKVHFDDVTEEVFGGKEDLDPGEMVACIITKIAKTVFHSVVSEMPKQVAKAVAGAGTAAVEGMRSSVNNAMKKIPCGA